MSYDPSLVRGCPAPYYNASGLPDNGGLLAGRICIPNTPEGMLLTHGSDCCLPCPSSQWIYPPSYNVITETSAWLNVVSLILMSSLAVSYLVLPSRYTGSHYLNTCLIVSVVMINLGFIIPHGKSDDTCANAITPNDIYSSNTCAFSGAFILGGGLCGSMWVMVRSFSMHLQVVWNIVPNNTFFYWTQFVGWTIPAAIFTAAITASGTSYRFGPGACHINHDNSIVDFWGWLIAFAGITLFVQIYTLVYCFHYYLRNMLADDNDSEARQEGGVSQVFQRVRDVILLQWRGIALVFLLLISVVFFTIVFIYLDTQTNPNSVRGQTRGTPWGLCLIENPNNPEVCFALGQQFSVNLATIGAVLIVLSLLGILGWPLLFRWSIMSGWKYFFLTHFMRRHRIISPGSDGDVHRNPSTSSSKRLIAQDNSTTTYEMQRSYNHPSTDDTDKHSYPFVDENPITETSPVSAVSSPDHKILMQQHFARQMADRQQGYGLMAHRGYDNVAPPALTLNHQQQHHPQQAAQYAYAQQQQQQQQQHVLRHHPAMAELPHALPNKAPAGFL